MSNPPSDLRSLKGLKELVGALRGPEGCPWDKEQTHQSLCPYAVEEVFELVEAIEQKNDIKTKDELGDVLFQVALHSQLAEERGAFKMEDVIENLNRKMIRRHPHVFSGQVVKNTDEVIQNWETLKNLEKNIESKSQGQNTSVTADANIDDSSTNRTSLAENHKVEKTAEFTLKNENVLNVPANMPALQRAAKIGFRTHKLEFDWPDHKGVLEKVQEEYEEFQEALTYKESSVIAEELGDLFFSLAQLARHLKLDPEQVARSANRKFEKRFAKMMEICKDQKLTWSSLSLEDKEKLWVEAKKA